MTRRSIAFLVLSLALAGAACAPETEGPADPAPAAELRGAPALLQAQIRGAAVRFVEAYRTTVLGGDDLRAFAATPLMRRFAYWLGVTNRSFPGEIVASSTVSGVGPATAVGSESGVIEVDLVARVDVTAQPPQGDPLEFSVPLDGPVRFAATEPGAWRVLDFVRFGVPVSRAFVPLDLRFRRPGVDLVLDSFGGVPNWSFFVRLAATGPRSLTLEESDVSLVDASGTVVGRAIEVSVPLLEVAPGGRIDGALTFEQLDAVRGVSLRIDLNGDRDPVPLEIPLRTIAQADPAN
jgi:hypothetical protein